MVEGGRIDLAAHDDDQIRNALDTIAFDEAVAIALDYVEDNNNTILIVTADHETEGLMVLSNNLGSELPADLFSEEDKRTLRVERANNVIVNWTASYHTDWSVPLFGYGTPFVELQDNYNIDNTEIFTLMKDYYLGNPLNVVEYTAPETTTTSTSVSTNTTSTSGNGSPAILPIDPMILTIAVVGAAVFVILIIIRKR